MNTPTTPSAQPQAAPEKPVALVTGGTSGIGLAVVRDLARRGHRVFLCARTAETVKETVEELRAEGLEVSGLAADVRSREAIAELVAAAVAEFGPISVLVNNAGRSGGGPTADISDELWYDVIDTNLNSVFLLTREVLKHGGLAGASYGRIINIASTSRASRAFCWAPRTRRPSTPSSASPRPSARSWPRPGSRSTRCAPATWRRRWRSAYGPAYAAAWDTTTEDVQERFEAKIPLGRYATPEEVAAMVGYLTTDLAASVTAQALNVCGGLGNF